MILSIDVGGTKTEAVLYDDSGSVCAQIRTASCHPMNASDSEIDERLSACMLGGSCPVVFGYAGYGRSEQMKRRIDACIARAAAGREVTVLSDIDMALEGVLEGKDGTAVILGTGSIALLRKNGRVSRCGGWGFLLGDEGSGYAVGRSVLRAFALMADGRLTKDSLYDAVMTQFSLASPNDLISLAVRDGHVDRTLVASAARIALDHPESETAVRIMRESAAEAAGLIVSAADPALPVAVTGGLSRSRAYLAEITAALPEGMHAEAARHEPVYGGYIWYRKQK